MKTWRKARAGSIWRWGGGRNADADALRKLRREIVEECIKAVKGQMAALGKKPPEISIGAQVAINAAVEALEKLKE